jgi:hypothetical protein
VTGHEVDDAETSHAETDTLMEVITGIVGPAMGHRVAHGLDLDGLHPPGTGAEDPRYTAHSMSLL